MIYKLWFKMCGFIYIHAIYATVPIDIVLTVLSMFAEFHIAHNARRSET